MWIFCWGLKFSDSRLHYHIIKQSVEDADKGIGLGQIEAHTFQQLHQQYRDPTKTYVIETHQQTDLMRLCCEAGEGVAVISYRDLRDVFVSEMNREGESFRLLQAEHFLHTKMQNFQLWSSVPRVYMSKYEDMITDLKSEVLKIANFLELNVTPSQIEACMQAFSRDDNVQRDSITAQYQNLINDNLHWSSELTLYEILFIEHLCGEWLQNHGYSLSKDSIDIKDSLIKQLKKQNQQYEQLTQSLKADNKRLTVQIEDLRNKHRSNQEHLALKEQAIVALLKYQKWSLRYWGSKLRHLLIPDPLYFGIIQFFKRIYRAFTRVSLLSLKQYPPREMQIPHQYFVSPDNTINLPTISIVTPSFNQVTYIETTIKSVIDQNYPHLEYIIQDAASDDGTQVILDKYADKLAHIESKPDGGQTNAVNIGFSKAHGDIMAYLNSDDILLPGSLHCIGMFFAQNPHIDVIYGHRILINGDGKEIGRWLIPQHNNEIQKWADFIPQETLFWRRSLWEKVGEFDESFKFALDWDYIVRMQEAGAKFYRLPRFLGGFRVHDDQKTFAMESTGEAEMNRIRERIHDYKPPPSEVHAHLKSYYRKNILLHILYRLGWVK